jgi:hypothetical protein
MCWRQAVLGSMSHFITMDQFLSSSQPIIAIYIIVTTTTTSVTNM